MPLTDVKIRSLKAKEKPFKAYDGKGLYLEIYPSGSRLWRLRYTAGGRQTRKSLGPYPEVSLARARDVAYEFLRDLGRKGVPARPEKPLPFADLGREWLERHSGNLTERTSRDRRCLFERHIVPRIGVFPVSEMTPRLLLERLLRPLETEMSVHTAHRAKSMTGRILRYGVATGRCERDSTRDLDGALRQHVSEHRRTVTDRAAIGGLLRKLDSGVSTPAREALRLLPYVFTRPGELAAAEWGEIDFKGALWRIPAGRMKMRRPHLVPLSRQVLERLSFLKRLGNGSRFVFPAFRRPGGHVVTTSLNKITVWAGLNTVITPHGFRAMASTVLNEAGYQPDWIERQLAHVEGNSVRAAYNHAQYLPERRKMMQDWADMLDSFRDGGA
ncbi:MAG: tyrosine-type recombinase/integrase [Deltaproteobacteria bacterium]|nr:tyrosine-type recombinase/integrase [Deltaproteobacteria bacterium]